MIGYKLVPVEPTAEHIDSIAMRYRHDFGLLPEDQRDNLRRFARQMYEECTGQGFYQIQPAPAVQGEPVAWRNIKEEKPEDGQDCITKMKHGIIQGCYSSEDDAFFGYYWRNMEWYATHWLPAEAAIYTAPQPAEQQLELAKYQPCGCVICTCEHETQCQGCGARHCGTHPLAQLYEPAYQQPAPDVSALVEALDGAARSLETISRQAGIDEYMSDFSEVRGYARNRAMVAFNALAAWRGNDGEK